jgi:hypothetical protein
MFIRNDLSSYEQELPPPIKQFTLSTTSSSTTSSTSDDDGNQDTSPPSFSFSSPIINDTRSFQPEATVPSPVLPIASLPRQEQQIQQEALSLPSSKTAMSRSKEERVRFALFLKILLQVIAKTGDRVLVEQCRIVISTCIRRARMGDVEDLHETLQEHLRPLVGEMHWAMARDFQRYYLRTYNKKRRAISSSCTRPQLSRKSSGCSDHEFVGIPMVQI